MLLVGAVKIMYGASFNRKWEQMKVIVMTFGCMTLVAIVEPLAQQIFPTQIYRPYMIVYWCIMIVGQVVGVSLAYHCWKLYQTMKKLSITKKSREARYVLKVLSKFAYLPTHFLLLIYY